MQETKAYALVISDGESGKRFCIGYDGSTADSTMTPDEGAIAFAKSLGPELAKYVPAEVALRAGPQADERREAQINDAWSEGHSVGYYEALSLILAEASRLRDDAYSVSPERSAGAQGEGPSEGVCAECGGKRIGNVSSHYPDCTRSVVKPVTNAGNGSFAALSVPPERERTDTRECVTVYAWAAGQMSLVADPSIPYGEVQIRDEKGSVLMRIVGFDAARPATPPEDTP